MNPPCNFHIPLQKLTLYSTNKVLSVEIYITFQTPIFIRHSSFPRVSNYSTTPPLVCNKAQKVLISTLYKFVRIFLSLIHYPFTPLCLRCTQHVSRAATPNSPITSSALTRLPKTGQRRHDAVVGDLVGGTGCVWESPCSARPVKQ